MSHYLLFLETVCPTLLPKLGQFGLGIFCQESGESLNHLIKTVFLTLTNRGGSTRRDDTLPRNTSDNMHSQSIALRQCLQYIFFNFTFRCLSGEKLGGMSLLMNASKNWRSGLQIMTVRMGKTMTLILNV